jgi:3-methyladenine DNA glycosylase AlkD
MASTAKTRTKSSARPRAAREAAPEEPTASAFLERLEASATEAELKKYERYFPPAERKHGDAFIGVRMGTVFELAKAFIAMPPAQIEKLMESDVHEARAGAMSIMARQYAAKTTTPARRQELYELYLRRHDRINSWDLVDLAAYYVVGPHLIERKRDVLHRLARSKNPWERRTAILATFAFIRRGELDDTFAIAELLLDETEDLIQKAVGWALRTAGSDRERLRAFLDRHAATMPRPMLRNAIEKFPPAERRRYLGLKQTELR